MDLDSGQMTEVVLRCGAALSTVLTGPIRLVIVGEGGQINWLQWNTEFKWTSSSGEGRSNRLMMAVGL